MQALTSVVVHPEIDPSTIKGCKHTLTHTYGCAAPHRSEFMQALTSVVVHPEIDPSSIKSSAGGNGGSSNSHMPYTVCNHTLTAVLLRLCSFCMQALTSVVVHPEIDPSAIKSGSGNGGGSNGHMA
jgi:hypothetical protein